MIAYQKCNVLTADLLASQHIAATDLAKEPQLQHACWWDYRGMHPTNRTLLFVAEYVDKSQLFHGKYRDYARHKYVGGVRASEHVFPSVRDDEAKAKVKRRNLTGFWRARQAADELGMSYNTFLMSIFEKTAMGGWQHRPRPSQLYSDKMKTIALDGYLREMERYIPDFENELLKLGSKAPFKRDFDDWLFELGCVRTAHRDLAFNRMADLGYISRERAESWTLLAQETA